MNLPLKTQCLRLRDFGESDWQAVHQYASDRNWIKGEWRNSWLYAILEHESRGIK